MKKGYREPWSLLKSMVLGIPLSLGIWGSLWGGLYLLTKEDREFFEKQAAEASTLMHATSDICGRITSVDEERKTWSFSNKQYNAEYLRINCKGIEYDLIIGGTTPLQVGDSLCAKYFNKQTLEDMATNSMIYSVSGHDGLFSRDFLNLAVSSKVDGLIFDYRRIK